MGPRLTLVALALVASLTRAADGFEALPIEITPSGSGMAITAGGGGFAEYRTDSAGRPVVWPLVGPEGVRVTREWPIAPRAPFESTDHPHQRGLWVGYGDVNGIDFWKNPGPRGSTNGRGRIVHRRFERPVGDGPTATLVCHSDWIGPSGEVVCHDERSIRFAASPSMRWIDFKLRLRPASEPLLFGDSKEGLLAIRVAGPLREDAHQGGQIVSSQGLTGRDAWGQRAAWVDYYGQVGQTDIGVAIISHPSNPRPRPRWHVRSYGLLAVNPFGEAEFPPIPGYRQGPVKVNVGDDLTLRYQVVLHLGDEKQANLEALYREYASR